MYSTLLYNLVAVRPAPTKQYKQAWQRPRETRERGGETRETCDTGGTRQTGEKRFTKKRKNLKTRRKSCNDIIFLIKFSTKTNSKIKKEKKVKSKKN